MPGNVLLTLWWKIIEDQNDIIFLSIGFHIFCQGSWKNMDRFDSSVIDMTWGGIQGNPGIQIDSLLVCNASEISLESLEYLLRFVFFGRPWIPSGVKLIKAVLSFFSLFAASFYWVFLFVSSVVYDSAYSFWKGKNWAEYRAHSFIWEPQFLATVLWNWYQGLDVIFCVALCPILVIGRYLEGKK